MKTIITISFILFTMWTTGQNIPYQVKEFNNIPKEILYNLDKMGVDTTEILNEYESEFLNFIFKSKSRGFDFTNKKIAFLSNEKKQNKKEYFKEMKERYTNNYSIISSNLYIFNKKQKNESGGYDAAIRYWNKFVIPIEKIVERLSKCKNNKKKRS